MLIKPSLFVLKTFSFQNSFQFFPIVNRFKRLDSLAIASSLLLGIAFTMVAQTPAGRKRLPPPPLPSSSPRLSPLYLAPMASPRPQSVTVPSPSSQSSTSVIREYTFQAPQAPPPRARQSRSASVKPLPFKSAKPQLQPANLNRKTQPVASPTPVQPHLNFYRVEVPGTNEALLAQVRSVEPLAVVWDQQGVIYGGIFPQQKLAQERVHQLQKKGVSAKIVSLSRPK